MSKPFYFGLLRRVRKLGGERELIGYDKDGSDGWSVTWNFGNRSFHDRIVVQALGSDGATQDKEIISITSE
ncbi:hypothetical protein D3C81_1607060 [compost metagenome]